LHRDPEHRGELGVVAAVLGQGGGARLAPVRDGAGVVAVGREVDGVHRVPARRGSWVALGERDVGGGESGVELAQQVLATGLPHAAPSLGPLRTPLCAP